MLKCINEDEYEMIEQGTMNFFVDTQDDIKVGDIVILQKVYDVYPYDELTVKITQILDNREFLKGNYVVLGIELLESKTEYLDKTVVKKYKNYREELMED